MALPTAADEAVRRDGSDINNATIEGGSAGATSPLSVVSADTFKGTPLNGGAPSSDLGTIDATEKSFIRYQPTTDVSISGIEGADNQILILFNNSDHDITLKHNDSGTDLEDRIQCPANTNYTMSPRTGVILFRVPSWRIIASS